jgi:hypothetical protein
MIIGREFNGPPRSGHGGYSAGLVASQLDAGGDLGGDEVAEVSLRRPPPLETPLRVARSEHGIEVYDGDQLVADASPVRLEDPPPSGVGYDEAVAAAAAYAGFVDHPFPTCYACGPERADGLRIFPGSLGDGRGVAAPWRVPDGVSALTVWAALDCPGGWATIQPGRPYMLGRMAARVLAVPPAGADCVVVGVVVGTEGRKAQVRTALYSSAGELLALARAIWIAI